MPSKEERIQGRLMQIESDLDGAVRDVRVKLDKSLVPLDDFEDTHECHMEMKEGLKEVNRALADLRDEVIDARRETHSLATGGLLDNIDPDYPSPAATDALYSQHAFNRSLLTKVKFPLGHLDLEWKRAFSDPKRGVHEMLTVEGTEVAEINVGGGVTAYVVIDASNKKL